MYLNVQRAARRLGVAPHTVRRWTASGFLPCTRTPGGHRRIREEDVEELAQHIGGSTHLAARRARERELETLLETSIALVSRLELEDLLKEIARQVTRLLDCHFCAISTLNEEAQSVRILADYDRSGRRLPGAPEYPLARYPLTRRVLEGRMTAVVNLSDPAADSDERRELEREGDKSLLMVPLVYRGRSIGLIEVMDHLRERRYSRQELRLCGAVAGQAAVALVNALTFAEATAASGEIGTLCARLDAAPGALGRVGEAEDLTGSLEAAAEAACRLFGGTSCVVSARGRSAGYDGGTAAPDAAAGDRVRGGNHLRISAVGEAEVLSATDSSGGCDLRVTLSLPRAAQRGEAELLGLLARTVGLLVDRLPG
ncbi:MAG TPA: GAF domain-containing protein [Thermoleophilia bacterium]|nr:GAF domain-containing protein [Thermoleophilia bacterium]